MKYFLKPASADTYCKAYCDNDCESIPDLLNNGWSECDETTYNAASLYTPPAPDPTPTLDDISLDLLADHEERLCLLEIKTAI